MKRFILLFLPLFFLLSPKTTGQNSIPLTNNGFENWSTGSGYSVSILTLYSSYPYPTGWNYPTYPVNESISLGFTSVNVNTNLPLLKVANETSGVPEGSHAVKLQSFKLSDIISSTAYNLASSSLDESLTTTVFPTVLSTGVIDIDQLLPLMGDLTSNLDNLPQLVSVFAGVDLNNLINGGISLNGEIIGRMTGYYKYSSAVGGDNGGVLMLGSKYNPATHRRELVGVGYTTALTDVSSYTPFEINYSPLSEIDDTYSYVQADSLIVMLLSSANTDAQQGSALYLDNLQLWTGFPPTVVADPTFGDTTATACGNFNWFGEVLTASGDYTHLFENGNANGGDSTVTLHLTINQPTEGEVTVAACGSYSWFGEDLTTSGDYPHLLENGNANGCDSTVTLHLTINQPTEGEVTVAECGSYNWFGEELTASGDYSHLIENGNANGCDSTVTLHLTINQPTEGEVTVAACGSYSWFGEDFTTSGDYPHLLENGNAHGCDSTVTLHLTINNGTYSSVDTSVCDSYEWHDITYTESGTYVFEYTNDTDCLSADTLHLTVVTINTEIELHVELTEDGENYVFVSQENAEYQWMNCETNELIEGATQQQFTPEISGNYACIITLGECIDTTECEYVSAGVGIIENSTTDITLYPNPTTGIVNVQLSPETCNLNPEIHVFDVYGRMLSVVETMCTSSLQTVQIDLSHYANGIYLLKVVAAGKVISVGKVVKE